MSKIEEVIDLMERMGENLHCESIWDVFMSDMPIIINEGLIKSYDSNMVLSAICDSFHLRKNGKHVENIIMTLKGKDTIYVGDAYLVKGENDEEIIKIILDANEKFINVIEKRMEKYGWSLYRCDKNINQKTEFLFEKRYPECFTAGQLLKVINSLYHVAPSNIINKILKQGLIPKESKTIGFNNEPRIYLWLQNMKDVDWSDMLKARNNGYGVSLQIDLNKLNYDHKFYVDQRIPNAFFSLEPIPPSAIKILK